MGFKNYFFIYIIEKYYFNAAYPLSWVSRILDFSEKEDLGIRTVNEFVSKVVLYGSKSEFDQMLISASNLSKETKIPRNYVGVGLNREFHVVSWEVYKQIHSNDSVEDYTKLLTHELAHLLHIAFLKGKENDMGPEWFFEGFHQWSQINIIKHSCQS